MVACLPVAALAVAAREGFPPLVDTDQRLIGQATDVTRAHPGLRDALVVWQEIFQPWRVYLAATPAVVWVWWRGRRARAAWGFVTMMVGWNLGLDVKLLVQRARPILEEPVSAAPGFSFPSGHVFNVTMAVTTLIVMAWPLFGHRRAVAVPVVATGALVVVLTALDRVYLGVHFPSDVIAGVLLALAITYSSWVGFSHRVPGRSTDEPAIDAPSPAHGR